MGLLCPLPFPHPFQFDYYNSVLINEKDKNGNYVELGAAFVLEANAHFSDLRVNTTRSTVQLPTNVYNKGTVGAHPAPSTLSPLVRNQGAAVCLHVLKKLCRV